MPQINQLNTLDNPNDSDLLPIYSQQNGDARKVSVGNLRKAIESGNAQKEGFLTQYSFPAGSGFTTLVVSSKENIWLILRPTAPFDAGTIKLPPQSDLFDGQRFIVNTTEEILNLTIDGNGANLSGQPVTLAKDGSFELRYDAGSNIWYRVSDTVGSALAVTYKPAGIGAVATTVQAKLREFVSVKDFGAVGDGVADDGAAINLALARLKALVAAVADSGGCVNLDLAGGVYRTTISLNATGLSSWGWSISNGTIVGECAGKTVLDLIGSRGGHLRDLVVVGSKTSMPRVGIMAARSSSGGSKYFCDNNLYENVSCIGYYSLAAAYLYAQETTTYNHCRFWNYNKDGYAAIHTGNDSVAAVQSDYETPVTGSHSYINDKYINCDYRYLPEGKTATVTAIGNSNNPTVTAAGHPFVNGDVITIGGITAGMTNINNLVGTVGSATANTFVLNGVNATTFGVFSGTATAVICQTKPTVYFARGEQHSFDTCYVVNYGTDSIQCDFPDSIQLKQLEFDWLFEGIGSRSHVRFTPGENTRQILGFRFRTYNTHCRDSIFSTNTVGSFRVALYNSNISVASNAYSTPVLFDVPSKYIGYDSKVFTPRTSDFTPSALADFVGEYGSVQDGKRTNYGAGSSSSIDIPYTPVVAAGSGSITSYTATGLARKVGNLVFVQIDVTITDNGTGASSVNIQLPVMSGTALPPILHGRENAVSGNALQGFISVGSNIVVVRTYHNQYPGATNARLLLSGVYAVN